MILKPVGLLGAAPKLPLEFIGFSKGTTTVNAHADTQEGDLVIGLAFNSSTTLPSGADWTSILHSTAGGSSAYVRVARVFAGQSAVTWVDEGGAARVGLWTFRNPNVSPTGALEIAFVGDEYIPYPAITATYANSWIICMGAHRRNNINYATTSPNADLAYIAVEPTSGTDTNMAAWFDSDGISSGNAGGNVVVRPGSTYVGGAVQVEIRSQ